MQREARGMLRRRLGRRALLLGAAAGACSRTDAAGEPAPSPRNRSDAGGEPASLPWNRSDAAGEPAPAPSKASNSVRLLDWDLGPQPWGQGRVIVVVPTWGATDTRFPVVVALHGHGEAIKPPGEGALGWPRDYALVRAVERLRAPPLREADYEGFIEAPRLATTNASLAARPFQGLIVVCPWMPDFHLPAPGEIAAYGRYLLGVLVPRVRHETPALTAPEATGIDGVSLGGATALRIGLTNPSEFGAVGALQPALDGNHSAEWTALAQAARAVRPSLQLRLLTSREDYFRDAITGLTQAWRAAGVAHDFADFPGPHDYVFNRGPGSLELLLWHDRALRR